MHRLTFTASSGESVVIGNEKPFTLLTIEGTGSSETDIQTQKAPFQDGSTHTDTLLEPRTITLTVLIRANDEQELFKHRRQLSRLFNPKMGKGVLTYEHPAGVNEIEATSELAPVFPDGSDNSSPTFQKAMITLFCPNPFWLDQQTETQEMAAWLGGLTFPLRLPTTFAKEGAEQIFENVGDVETPVTIEFFGPATNPRIDNLTTGEFIRIKRDLLTGEKLIIKTEFGNKTVTFVNVDGVESNAMHYIDLDSTFWQLVAGDNRVKYSADTGAEQAKVKITYCSRFVGV